MSYQQHLRTAYPPLCDLLEQVLPLPDIAPPSIPVAEAVTKIVVGQMLSRAAAETIYERLTALHDRHQLEGCWQLAEVDLLSCGLSRRKARCVLEFAANYDQDPDRFEAWRELEYSALSTVVSEHWGLSQWSADMLAIFYFGKSDVFPATDGTIIRVQRILERDHLAEPLDPELARPFRTSLARSMWALLDGGHIA